ncbi:cytochrome d ubiquinol oxidase subunit II [Pseudobacillus badius]|uniref:cytochrome d ubiquinol oxidase subunit II n=1 Tax=Bacillus badius TaxID=1455 RepID=UPI0007B063C8|nr:cytochrome d ubiquinol oxidase subunit II [Bacillus badius]KZO01522.1 cytochrome D ubiquinol oxidase subunit II [Bacillus badius]MED0667164.1 cytochrome d ubiquinol oxidase subunit II [Bacillus badius]OCS89917.1 cytochrome D ubiquinol oxidase subunit II [Bacillus badius]OVE53443.1 cytochrome D ubiquinol oxidase subunit II [Bacillus badius]TDW05800.1 cytochrome bd-I ubiquinol oxidase subunit 2 apoprotein [Bacillus badius]
MNLELLGITVLWTFLYGYLIVASIDFGAGFFAYYGKITKKDHLINDLISRYLSPVWEVTNVFFVFFFVGIVGFFPSTAYYFGTALLIPGSIAIILLAIRGSFYAFNNYGSRNSTVYLFLYGATGLLIPASLSTALTISEGGFLKVENDKVVFLAKELFASPYSWSVVALSIVSVLFISAAFLTYYADRANDRGARAILRKFALLWSPPTIVASLLVFVSLREHNPVHFNKAVSEYWWMFALSLICFMIASYLIYLKRNFGTAFIFVMLQFFFAFFGYGASHLPYILYPHVVLHESVTNETMAVALVIVFVLGLLLLVPSLYLLMKLFLFDADYVKGKKQ